MTMSVLLFCTLIFCLVPVQTTLLHDIIPAGMNPDLCLVATCLIGFLFGHTRGTGFGISIGFAQDLFSAGGMGLNMLIKGMAGFFSASAAHTLSTTAPTSIFIPTLVVSLFGGIASMISASPELTGISLLHETWLQVFPQTCINALLALGVNWMIGTFHSTADSSPFNAKSPQQ